jgi:hypothetical protein
LAADVRELLLDYDRIDNDIRTLYHSNEHLKKRIKELEAENEHLSKVSIDSTSSSESAFPEG